MCIHFTTIARFLACRTKILPKAEESGHGVAPLWRRRKHMPNFQHKRALDLIENRLALARISGLRRRAAMLSASAFTGAFALLMANPQSALAQCATSSAPNVVDCNASFASTNTLVV